MSENDSTPCANCGKGEEATGDLKACTACKMVKYCNRDCQIAHRPQHKKECKKCAAELHDEKLLSTFTVVLIFLLASGLLTFYDQILLRSILLGAAIILYSYFKKKHNRDCQIAHRPQHKKECKKRAAELHDEELFKEPPPAEDCPICMLPLPLHFTGLQYRSCCGKIICSGCIHAVAKRDGGVGLCPFCRTPGPISEEEIIKRVKKRVEAGDAEAIRNLGGYYSDGVYGMPQNHAKALELMHQAGELGHSSSIYNIGIAYLNGNGVGRDEKKAKHYFELAAMGGDIDARHNLGVFEGGAGNMDRALKHVMISTGFGCTRSLEMIKLMYMKGYATKDDYAKALRVYQENLVEIKSPQRDEAATFNEGFKYY